jgi:hypothetical protein
MAAPLHRRRCGHPGEKASRALPSAPTPRPGTPAADRAGALANWRKALTIPKRGAATFEEAETKRAGKPGEAMVLAPGDMAWNAPFVREFGKVLATSERARSLAPIRSGSTPTAPTPSCSSSAHARRGHFTGAQRQDVDGQELGKAIAEDFGRLRPRRPRSSHDAQTKIALSVKSARPGSKVAPHRTAPGQKAASSLSRRGAIAPAREVRAQSRLVGAAAAPPRLLIGIAAIANCLVTAMH